MSEMATVFGKKTQLTKTERYGWTIKDEQGKLRLLHKNVLQIHPAYQRSTIEQKVKIITAAWSWVACGAIIVGERGGEFWVIDGQHRVLAAKRRADINAIPCLVFSTDSVEQEARGFLDANTGRKPVSSLDKFRASIAAGDETAKYVDLLFSELEIVPKATATKAMEIKSVAWAMSKAKDNRKSFELVMKVAAELCRECPVQEILLSGLYYMNSNCKMSLLDKRLHDRLKKIGAIKLVEAAKRASAYFARGGEKIWAEGMLTEINKGLREKIAMKS